METEQDWILQLSVFVLLEFARENQPLVISSLPHFSIHSAHEDCGSTPEYFARPLEPCRWEQQVGFTLLGFKLLTFPDAYFAHGHHRFQHHGIEMFNEHM